MPKSLFLMSPWELAEQYPEQRVFVSDLMVGGVCRSGLYHAIAAHSGRTLTDVISNGMTFPEAADVAESWLGSIGREHWESYSTFYLREAMVRVILGEESRRIA